MSSSSVYQGLQSCLEPFLIEPRVLRLKLAPPGSNLSSSDSLSDSDAYEKPFTKTTTHTEDEHDMMSDKDSESGGSSWSFLHSLSNICNKTEDPEAQNVYVHPTVRCFSSMLSARSLEMCTESLGCETGSNASDSSDDMCLFSSENSSCYSRDHTLVVDRSSVSKRLNRGSSFPPPLRSMTDFGGVQVRPRREDGRLILEAVTSSSSQPYFQAERSSGRLRLRLFESAASYNGDEVDDDDEEEEEEEEADGQKQEACGEEDTGEQEELEEFFEKSEDEMGMTKIARASRCKESGNRDIFGDGYFEPPSLSLCL